ncbi:MAG: leucine-rich repeat domain-containing protein [Treponema sp.]|jgi:hypothetical protein|nr:leucine-rich repeat domain-containing protein [Treponema sp.]
MKQCMARVLALFVLAALAACSGGGSGGGLSSSKEITALSVNGTEGVINKTNRTVAVTVSRGTDLTAALTPTIEINGVDISPPSGMTQTFFTAAAGFIPVSYTVTAEDGSTADWTVMVRWEPLASVDGIGTYLGTPPANTGDGSNAANPIILPVNVDLSAGWEDLLGAINTAGKYVILDLSACTGMTAFDPGGSDTDAGRIAAKRKIVSLVLPDAAQSIKAGISSDRAFNNFTYLKSVTGVAITNIGDQAFSGCTYLATVSFPKA